MLLRAIHLSDSFVSPPFLILIILYYITMQ
nr:MAG TPA: hypothetical protein [Caudoviricetes sp.]